MSLLSVEFGEPRNQDKSGSGIPRSMHGMGESDDTQRALINILDDLTAERANFEDGQRALLNILDDLTVEQMSFEDGQRALLNILDDLTQEQSNFEGGQRALLNILEDSETEKKNLGGAQSAVLNILEDFDIERSKVEAVNRDLYAEIEERRRAQRKIKTLNRELEQRVSERTAELAAMNNELEAFAYSVSHDLRAPLRHLDGFLSLLSKRSYALLDAPGKHYIDCTLEASRRMGRLIDDLLQFSRLGRSEVRKQLVALSEIVDAARKELEPETRDRVIEWQIGDLPVVEADPGMLRQVVQNLIGNALKFTRNRVTATISIENRNEADGGIVIVVRDNGAGFDMRFYDKLFNVFQRLHSEDEFEGTGIGLANVRRIVERHGGRIWAEAAVDAGAAFYFSLPAGEQETGEHHESFATNPAG